MRVRIAPQRIPVAMPGYAGDPRNVPVHLEQPTDALVAKVVEVQVLDLQELAGPRPRCGDRVPVVREYLRIAARHGLQDRPGLVRQMAPDVVADLLPRVFMSRTSTAYRRSSRPSQRIRVISSCRRVENSAKASTFGRLIELGRRCCISKTCSSSRSSSSAVGRRSRSLLRLPCRACAAPCAHRPGPAGPPHSPMPVWPPKGLRQDGPGHCSEPAA